MKLLIHDYAGHPFQVQLSRHLAQLGYDVVHAYSASIHTPQGDLVRREDDSPGFDVRAIRLSRQISKYDFVERFRQERKHARKLVSLCEEIKPQAVLSGNTPTIAQHYLTKWGRRNGVRIVTWIQDMYGIAAYRILSKKLPLIGPLVGRYFIHLDRQSYRMSDGVVPITEDFCPQLKKWGIESDRIKVIHNWATIDQLPMKSRDNAWSRSHASDRGLRFLYSGTLSVRHNPGLLLALARRLDQQKQGQLIVVSEGAGVDWLKEQCQGLKSVRFFDFQPFEMMPNVFATADVLLAILEPDAGVFCVPSKVLSYMCAGRPLLTAMPKDNLAARLVSTNHIGLNVAPDDEQGFLNAAQRLSDSEDLRMQMGKNSRRYAEEKFDIDTIANEFLQVLAPGYRPHRTAKEIPVLIGSQSTN